MLERWSEFRIRTDAITIQAMNNYDPMENDLERVEFHRHAVALMPDASDPRPGIAFLVEGQRNGVTQRFCSCSISKKRTCDHTLELTRVYKRIEEETERKKLRR